MIAHLSVAVGIIYVILGVISLCLASILIIKTRTEWIERKEKESLIKLQDYFTYLQTHIDAEEELRMPHLRLNSHERRVVQKKLIQLIELFKGAQREKLTALCEDMQLVRHDLKRLQSPLPWVRIDAVYHLGAMRSEQAITELMKMLKAHKYDPSVFIIARSIAMCSNHLKHLREMVLLLVRYRKSFHQLVVDIMGESEIDCTPLMVEFLNEEDSDLVNIALEGLPAYAVPGLLPQLHRLLESGNEEIRIKAGKLLYNDNSYDIAQNDRMNGHDIHLSEMDELHLSNRQQHSSQRLSYTKAV